MKVNKVYRINKELKDAGVTNYGLSKMAMKDLPNIIHDDENIKGVVYGQIGGGNSASLIATNKRILYIDKRIMFATTDEITYDVVSGIQVSSAGPFTSIILHTRIHDYVVRYVNSKCARIFREYIEKKRIEVNLYDNQDNTEANVELTVKTNSGAIEFLNSNNIATISSVDRTGKVHGAIVYYHTDKNNNIYIVTKSDTEKSKSILYHSQVALTIFESETQKTLQIEGLAFIEKDHEKKNILFEKTLQAKKYKTGIDYPPVTKLKNGSFIIVRIQPYNMKFNDYSKK